MLHWVIKALEDSKEAEQRDIGSVYIQVIDSMTLTALDHNIVGDISPGLNPASLYICLSVCVCKNYSE